MFWLAWWCPEGLVQTTALVWLPSAAGIGKLRAGLFFFICGRPWKKFWSVTGWWEIMTIYKEYTHWKNSMESHKPDSSSPQQVKKTYSECPVSNKNNKKASKKTYSECPVHKKTSSRKKEFDRNHPWGCPGNEMTKVVKPTVLNALNELKEITKN